MDPRIARSIAAACATAATAAVAQVALPPQNYGTQPGFFRNAPEMQTFERANGIAASTPAAQGAATPTQAAAPAATVTAPNGAVVNMAPVAERIPDPTQNLQWSERQMDRAETSAVQVQNAAARAPQPVAPGAYNGQTDPATR
jgi:hypothetical protein